jgi:hypothetical protein
MACTWGSKVNGILTVFTIGIAVAIDLWDILDIKKEHTMVCKSRRPFVRECKIDILCYRTTLGGTLWQGLLV